MNCTKIYGEEGKDIQKHSGLDDICTGDMRSSEPMEQTGACEHYVNQTKIICDRDSTNMPNVTQLSPMNHVTQHPAMIGLSPLQQAEVVLSGYRDCAAEAIRYLIEVENIPPEDPLVVGLQTHLYEKQKHLDFVQILLQCHENHAFSNPDSDIEEGSMDDSGISFQSETEVVDTPDITNSETNTHSQPISLQTDEAPFINVGGPTTNGVVQSNVANVSEQTITDLAEEILSLIEEENQSLEREKTSDENEQ